MKVTLNIIYKPLNITGICNFFLIKCQCILIKLIKEAAASLRSAIAEIASKDERIAGLEKVSSVRKTVDEMLADGLISTYDVQEKVAEMLSANEYAPHISGNQFQKLAGDIDSKPQGKRGMFDSVIQ